MFTVGALHRLCFYLHAAAASTLLYYTLDATSDLSLYKREVSKAFTAPSVWHYNCYYRHLKKYSPTWAACPVEDRQFFIVHAADTFSNYKFDTFVAVIFFSYFSAACHLLAMLANSKESSTSTSGKLHTVFTRCFGISSINYNYFIVFPYTVDFATGSEVDYRKETLIRMIDYAATASVMVALFSVLWGASNIWGVFVSPILMTAIIFVAFRSSLKHVIPANKQVPPPKTRAGILLGYICDKFSYSEDPTRRNAWDNFILALILYGFVLGFGVINGLAASAKGSETNSRQGKMPPGVVVASVFVLVTFSSFVVPYILETRAFLALVGSKKLQSELKPKRDELALKYSSAWAAMSLVSKIVLHLAFGLTVVSQATIFAETADDSPPDNDMNISTRLAIFACTTIASGFALWGVSMYLLGVCPCCKKNIQA